MLSHTHDRPHTAPRLATRALVASIALGLIALTIAYRFLTMGGPLGGFENDQFVTLSQAQQIVMGEWPMRDFVELGMPLTVMLSALGQAIIGRTLFAEAMVTMGLLGLCTAVLFVLAWRASGSIAIALIVALIQIAMAPRFYNYPKLLAYAIAIPAFWWYIDRPDRRRLTLIAIAGVIAFLLRHDHGLYVGLAGMLTVAIVQWPSLRTAAREIALLGAIALAIVLPYLMYIQVHDGVVPYFRSFVEYANQSAERTQLRLPGFSFDWSQPLVMRVAEPKPAPRINIRWTNGLTDDTRAEHERELGLIEAEPRAPGVSNYALADWSKARLAAIVRDPMVADTAGIDRGEFVLNDPQYTRPPTVRERAIAYARSVRILPSALHSANAVPFLYYLMYAVPIAALVIVFVRPEIAAEHWNRSGSKIAVVAILALLAARGFLRGNLPSRLADVSEIIGVLAAWVAAVLVAQSSVPARRMAAAMLLVVVILTSLSVEAIEHVSSELVQTGVTTGIRSVRSRARDVYTTLTATPPVEAWPATEPGIERLAHYIAACTRQDDRVLTLGYTPEVFFMTHRRFAAGNVWILPDFYTSRAEQQLMIDRIHAHRVPIAFTPPEPVFTDDYIESFPDLTATLGREYRDVRTVDFGRGFRFRVLVRRDLEPSSTYAIDELPCFS
jgi:hypothetical protein